ncbi:unnamed protein product, partial [Phaeothamnion confervicola]
MKATPTLHLKAREGDLQGVAFAVLQRLADINEADFYGATPLYYACLCGHEAIIRFLLENGARCEEDTYEGERCFYAALRPDLRRLLQSWAVTAAHRDPFEELLRRMLQNGRWADVVFNVRGTPMAAHRVVLAARCEYFGRMFETVWAGREVITLSNSKVDPRAFAELLRWLYTGRASLPSDVVEKFVLLCRQTQMPHLEDEIGRREK